MARRIKQRFVEDRYLVTVKTPDDIVVYDVPACDFRQHLTTEEAAEWLRKTHTPVYQTNLVTAVDAFIHERQQVEKHHYRVMRIRERHAGTPSI